MRKSKVTGLLGYIALHCTALLRKCSEHCISVGSLPVSIHVSVELPGADTLVAAELALDVLGRVPGQDDGGHLVTGNDLL